MKKNNHLFNTITQIAIPVLTVGTQIAIALKYPQWGLVINLISQPFWIYSSWKAYKKAGQVGLLITTVLVTVVILLGIINYFFM
ncbi:hypothetical protein CO005_00580 [Candidatus Roizmanbacteria bacterium CG_4_8_14_3_um_filter_34_9]|uniref:Uncharacterized protein n=2 Tax=Candidatus Roizmaniibacteriota TaxID=1752723 RepID=A0A2M6YSV1_9BACT|nr:MAG: hypothetical protein COT02_05345 [Candidatus Roizmanbacteria bacterium CG07_land_8_20_14_0_80_34_15]PIW73581.1 MAG: hypothetical protein CO005_00580 [Candidatus Roizmanbacteria bacterium CG_4_8_14_3_um_filter_34_9]